MRQGLRGECRLVLHAGVEGEPAGEERTPRRGADLLHIVLFKTYALGCERIDVGCGEVRAVVADVRPANIVDDPRTLR